MQKQQDRFSIKKRFKSFGYAFQGIVEAARSQHNLWIHIVAAFLVIITGFVINISTAEWLFLIFAIGFVLTAELFNSAIERFVDLVSPEKNEIAGSIKDIAAGAVLVAAITAAIIGLLIFVPRINNLI